MGFEPKRPTTLLKWAEGQELHGLEVELRELSVDRWLALNRLSAELVQLERTGGEAELAAKADRFFSEFARALQSWNLLNDGQPVPATRDGVGAQPLAFVMKLVTAWMGAAGAVDTPLPDGSPNGHPSALEHSIPMAPPSSPPGS